MVFHLCVRNFLINAFYIEYLGCRCGNRSDACDSVGFSRATSECPHHEVNIKHKVFINLKNCCTFAIII